MDKKQMLAWLLIVIMIFQTGSPSTLQAGVGSTLKASDTVWDVIEDEDAGWMESEEDYDDLVSFGLATPSTTWIIVEIDQQQLKPIEVLKGTAIDEINLPKTLTVQAYATPSEATETNSSQIVTKNISVTWNCDKYNSEISARYPFKAVLPKEYELKAGVNHPTVEVLVLEEYLITFYATPSGVTVPYGTEFHELNTKLPKKVAAYGRLASPSDSAEGWIDEYDVQWEIGNYDEDAPGTYQLPGKVTFPDYVKAAEDLEGPLVAVNVEEQKRFDATITLDWLPISEHDTPNVEALKKSILEGLSGERTLPDTWKDDLTISIAPKLDGLGWICTIKGLPAQYGSKELAYKIKPVLKDFVFTDSDKTEISATAPTINILCRPVLKPRLKISTIVYGTHLEKITYVVKIGDEETEYEVAVKNSSDKNSSVKDGFTWIQLPDEIDRATVWIKDAQDEQEGKKGQQLHTWGDKTYSPNFSTETPFKEVSFCHSAMIEPAIVSLNWNDNNNAKNKRPDADKFSLTLGAPEGLETVLLKVSIDKQNDASFNTWKWTYSGLPRYDKDGTEIPYTLTAGAVEGFILETLKGTALHGFEARYTTEGDFEVKIKWLDSENKYTSRPMRFPENSFTLWKDGVKTNWDDYTLIIEGDTLRVKGLPAYKPDGIGNLWSIKQNEIVATASNTISGNSLGEDVAYKPNYVNTGSLALVTDAIYHGGTIENRLSDTFTFTGTKIWQDGDDTSKRTKGSLILQRYLSDSSIQNATPISGKSTIELNRENESYKIEYKELGQLPRFDEQGREYIYFVTERFIKTPEADSYEKIFKNTSAYVKQPNSGDYLFPGGTLTNRRIGEIVSNVTVRWNTAAQQSVNSSVVLVPQSRVKGTDTWTSMASTTVGPFFAEQLSIKEKFTWPKYDDKGQELEYQVVETEVTVGTETAKVINDEFTIGDYSYVVKVDTHGNDVTITHSLDGTHEVTITKVWDKGQSGDVSKLEFILYQNGSKHREITMGKGESDKWGPIELTGLDAYDGTGKLYTYDVREVVPSGYYATYSYGDSNKDPHKTNVTVTNTPAGVSSGYTLTLEKEWLDGGDTVYREPVTIGVYRRATQSNAEDKLVIPALLNKANNWWKYVSVPAVYKDVDGEQVKKPWKEAMTEDYYVREISMGTYVIPYKGNATHNDDFEGENQHYAVSCIPSNLTPNVYTATNRRIGTLDICVDTSWVDGGRSNKERPNLKLTLYRNVGSNSKVEVKSVTLDGTPDEGGETGPWQTKINKLDKYDEMGNLYNYTFDIAYTGTIPADIADYDRNFSRESYVVGDKHTGDTAKYHCSMKRQTILTDFVINLIWMDNGFTDDSIRPNTQLILYRKKSNNQNPEIVTNAQRTWNTQMTDWHWTCGFDGLPKYDSEGYLYEYYVESTLSTKGDYITRYYNAQPKNNQFRIDENVDKELKVGPQGGTVVHRRENQRNINGTKTWQNVPGAMEASEYPEAKFGLKYYQYKEELLSKDGMLVSNESNAVKDPNDSSNGLFYTIKNGGNSFDFGTLPRYDSLGRNIQYFVKEEPISGYVELTGAVGQFVLSNAYNEERGESRTVTVQKKFTGLPENLASAHYPTVTMELWRQMQNGKGEPIGTPAKVETKSIPMTGNSAFSCEFTMLTYAPNAREWLYTIKEKTIDGYTIQGTPGDGYLVAANVPIASSSNPVSINNEYTGGEKRIISITKTWEDQDNRYKTRPAEITVNLYRNDGVGENQLHKTQTLTETDGWKHEFANLETYAPNGAKYKYYVQEEEVKGYEGGTDLKSVGETATETVAITNTLKTTDLPVTKKWLIEGKELIAGTASFGLLPDDMQVELTLQRRLKGTKEPWVTVQRDETEYIQKLPIKSNEAIPKFTYKDKGYEYTFEKLPGFDSNGNEYEYRVRETGLYSAEITGGSLTVGIDSSVIGPYKITYDGTTITNKLQDVKYLYIQPIWDDVDNQDGLRPTSLKFAIDGKASDSNAKTHTITVSKPTDMTGIEDANKKTHWSLHAMTLPAKSLNAADISYDGNQENISGYAVTKGAVETVEGKKSGTCYPFTFAHIPKTLTLNVEKKWDYAGVEDQEYRDLVAGTTVYAQLWKGTGDAIKKVEEKELLPLTNSNWMGQWDSLPAAENTTYKDVANTGKSSMIPYTVRETQSDGNPLENGKLMCFVAPKYTTYTAGNKTLPSPDALAGNVTITNTLETVSHQVTLNWVDSTNLYQTRPGVKNTATTMSLQRRKGTSGEFGRYFRTDIKDIALSTDLNKNQSSEPGTWSALPRYASDGAEYQYRALETKLETEVIHGSVTGEQPKGSAYNYNVTYDFTDKAATVVTNTNTVYEDGITFHVTKLWEDENNNDGARPDKVYMTLYRDGKAIQTKEVTDSSWEYEWKNLPKFQNGSTAESKYTVKEDTTNLPSGYSLSSQSNTDFAAIITNTYAPQRLTITASKEWANDMDYADQTRPEQITLKLQWRPNDTTAWTNCEGVEEKTIHKQLDGTWSQAVWENLYRYQGGAKMQYQVQEINVPSGYTTESARVNIVDGDIGDIETPSIGTVTLTNTLQTVNVTVKKEWDDDKNGAGVRPNNITVQLYRHTSSDATPVAVGAPITISKDGGWTHTFERLLKFAPKTNIPYIYSVVETHVGEHPVVTASDGKKMGGGYVVQEPVAISADKMSAIELTIKNKLPVVQHTVNVTWEKDEGDKAVARPSAVRIALQQWDGTTWKTIRTREIKKGESQTTTFSGLPQFDKNNQPYKYQAVETTIGTFSIKSGFACGYDATWATEGTTTTIINTLQTIQVKVEKEWNDADDVNQMRPNQVTVQLYRSETPSGALEAVKGATNVIASASGWSATYTEQLKYAPQTQNPYAYAVREIKVGDKGVATVGDNQMGGGYVVGNPIAAGPDATGVVSLRVTNTLPMNVVNITKTWKDGEHSSKTRPESIEVTLQRNDGGSCTNVRTSIMQKDTWTQQFTQIPKYTKDNKPAEYQVIEKPVPGYRSAVLVENGTAKLVNTLKTVSVTVEKTWDDENNKYGMRPEHITVQLYRQEGIRDEKEAIGGPTEISVGAGGTGKHTFTNLLERVPHTENPYLYSVEEIKVGTQPVQKTTDGKKVGGGYEVTEPAGVTAGAGPSITLELTNTLITTEHKVIKVWENDQNNKYETRPTNITIALQEFSDGTWKQVAEMAPECKEGTTEYNFTSIPKYTTSHRIRQYRAVETKIGEFSVTNNFAGGYHASWNTEDATGTTTIKNKLQTIRVDVKKTWEDAGDANKMRPDQVTVQLHRSKTSSGEVNAVEGEDAIKVLATAGNWSATYTEQLKYVPRTQIPYAYTVREIKVGTDDVVTVVDKQMGGGYVVGNPAATEPDANGVVSLSVLNTLPIKDFTITKKWVDDGHSLQTRPENIKVELQRNEGTGWTTFKDAIIKQPKWDHQFDHIPLYTKNNQLIAYQVIETPVPGYASAVAPVVDGEAELVNTLETVSVIVKKTWVDEDNNNAMRPETITVQLYRQIGSETPKKVEGASAEVRAGQDGTWQHTFPNQLKYEPKTETPYYYSVQEIKVGAQAVETIGDKKVGGGYEVTEPAGVTAGNGSSIELELTNSLILTEHKFKKVWENDQDNKYKTRPVSITAALQEFSDGTWKTVNKTAELKWEQGETEYSFTKLPKYTKDNQVRQYRVIETKVGNLSVIDGFAGGYFVSEVTNGNETVITNRLDLVQLEGEIDWQDDEDRYKIRPTKDAFTLELSFGGTTMPLSPEWQTGWTYRYSELPRWYVDTDGVLKIRTYQVKETIPKGYMCDNPVVDSNIQPTGDKVVLNSIVNRMRAISITGTKHWQDESDRWGLRPESGDKIQLEVQGDGTVITMTPGQLSWDGWNYTVHNLPHYNKITGNPVIYTVKEISDKSYELSGSTSGTVDADGNYTGVDFTNTLKTGDLFLTKIVVGDKAPDGLAFPFTVTLKNAGTKDGVYNGTYTHVSASGVETSNVLTSNGFILLKAGETAKITGIPVGASYVIEEQKFPGFAITSMNSTGTIQKASPSEAVFTNTVEASKNLAIENVTTTTGAPAAGGKVGVTTKTEGAVNPDQPDSDQKTDGIRVGWMPDEYWTFGDEIVLSWYQLGKLEQFTSRITNYIDEEGSLIPTAFDSLRTTWPDLTVSLTDTTVDLILGDSETMPVDAQVAVNFLPTMAVLNLTAEGNRPKGKVGFSEERLHPQSDGVKEIDGHHRSKNTTEILAQAEDGYRVNISQLTLAQPRTLGGEETIVPVTFGENNTFTAEIPITESTVLLRQARAATALVKGHVEVDLADTKGNAQHIRVVLESSEIPLDIGISFEEIPKSGGGNSGGGGPRPIVPETVPETVPATIPETVPETIPGQNSGDSSGDSQEDLWNLGDGNTPAGNMNPNSKRRSPATGDRTTTSMLLYAIASLLSGIGAIGSWRYWRRGKKKEDKQ